uniref:Radical SAM superfamily protein n=2 Tax=viral metagenome TaxID=1070528 RepID=A0A6M3LZY9_9ZZZZ
MHVDGKMPNLALMKLAAWHINQDDEVELLREGYHAKLKNIDKIYVSCIFPQNVPAVASMLSWFKGIPVEYGGPGFDKPSHLPEEVEHIRPWYPLYGVDYDMGKTTWGCPKKCPFCVVPNLEGDFQEHADIEEFHWPGHKNVVLMDNNYLYSTRWEETLDWINQRKMKVNFNQGLDLQYLTHEKADVLRRTRLYPSSFKKPGVSFAWDLMEEEPYVERGIKILKDSGFRMWKVQIYMLVGFNTTFEQDLYRVDKILGHGLDPFVMVYNHRRDDPQLLRLARWVNKHLYSVVDFKDYHVEDEE